MICLIMDEATGLNSSFLEPTNTMLPEAQIPDQSGDDEHARKEAAHV
jgi:hypothetical protein